MGSFSRMICNPLDKFGPFGGLSYGFLGGRKQCAQGMHFTSTRIEATIEFTFLQNAHKRSIKSTLKPAKHFKILMRVCCCFVAVVWF